MIGAFVDELARRVPELARGDGPIRSAIVVGADREPTSKVVLLLFASGPVPVAVAKVAREAGASASLRREHEALTAAHASASVAVSRCAPRPVLLDEVGGRLALVTTAMPGEPMTKRFYSPSHTARRRAVEGDFGAAAAWLSAFERETAQGSATLDEAGLQAWILPRIERYRETVGWSTAERDLFGDVIARARGLRVPLTAVHGDFWMGNILLEGRGISGVVDWELAQTEGFPFRDLYKFPTSYAFYLGRAGRAGAPVPGHPGRSAFERRWRRFGEWPNIAGFAYAYFGRGWFPDLVRTHISRALERLGAPRTANGVFFPLFLAEQAVANARVPDFRDGYRSLVLGLSEERRATWLWDEGVAA